MTTKTILVWGFCVLLGFSFVSQVNAEEEGWRIEQDIRIGDFTFQSHRNEMVGKKFQILCASETVFSSTKEYYAIKVMTVGEPVSIPSNPAGIARDVTKDGTPDLIVEVHSGGAHCCFGYYAFSLDRPLKKMFYIDDIDTEFELNDVDDDRVYELMGYDDVFNYWNTSHAESPYPAVILRYEGEQLHLAADLMRQRIPDPREIMENLPSVRTAMDKLIHSPMRFNTGFYQDFYPPLWGFMLDLIYAGWGEKAYEFFEAAWPNEKPDRDLFLAEFKKQLATSRYWSELKTMNGW